MELLWDLIYNLLLTIYQAPWSDLPFWETYSRDGGSSGAWCQWSLRDHNGFLAHWTSALCSCLGYVSSSLADGGSQNTSQAHDLEHFPALPIVRSRGDFSFDAISSNIGTKTSSRHPSLLPGIFLLHCQHGRTKFTPCEIFVAILSMFTVRNASICLLADSFRIWINSKEKKNFC